ncbi:DNA-binding response regulator, OmpR family [endosymbiont of Ridgeia piscesae]|uniref:DNA-binding response regulator, OmpR family n=2 Tax=endosymbiont of Ridgeia piscesae TaxID=54398 RepID=A0A0T5YWP8_9GAMM|nr:response regulator transcription factor [endosymbiont of Ridgeia piscesae]KRT55026.1 DNA-binding response regulator, OmpR family [endosymbiont of Ridgeia piscesae]
MRLLLVEDDLELVETLQPELSRAGFAVDLARDGIDGEFLGDEVPYDIVVLDLGLPGRPGLEVLHNWRSRDNSVPVLVLTARDAWHERVDGFKAGADDYLGKPFHVEELLERIKALIRRSEGRPGPQLKAAGLLLDEALQQVQLADGSRIDLTGTEYRLLHYFMLHPGQIVSKTRLTEHVYDQDFDRDSNLIEVYIRRLRSKLGRARIETRRGQGYIFVDDPA